MVFNPFKIAFQFIWTASNFPKFDGPCFFTRNQQAPGPNFRKVGKSLRPMKSAHVLSTCKVLIALISLNTEIKSSFSGSCGLHCVCSG